jgi:signal transduction histidine kinase
MTIRSRLILIYLVIISILLTLFCVIIYFQSEYHRKNESKNRLQQEALTAATIYFKKNEISPDLLKILDKNNFTALHDEEIIIYDFNNNAVYESGEDPLGFNHAYLEKIKQNKSYYWKEKQREFNGLVLTNNEQPFLVIASAIDKYGLRKQQNLAFMLILGGFAMLMVSSLAGWLFVKRMLQPINKMIARIDSIKSTELGLRLDEGNQKDELAQLSIRFNQMLERLQKAFLSQRAFVSNASHELRTPLTSITGQIQVSLLANDSPEELKLMISSVLDDVKQLNKLSNNLLDLTSIEIDNQDRTLVNILDKISRVRGEVLEKNSSSVIRINFQDDEDIIPELLGNAQLLYTAFYNLLENGIKYSPDKVVDVSVTIQPHEIALKFKNQSKLLSPKELTTIFDPFVRGSNSKTTKGHGVGLSLTKRIIELHNGKIYFQSSEKEGVTILITLPK